MRTTLTLEREVADQLKRETRRTGRPFKAVVNDALKRGLGLAAPRGRRPRFEVRPHAFGVKSGIDPNRLNQFVDELDGDAHIRSRS